MNRSVTPWTAPPGNGTLASERHSRPTTLAESAARSIGKSCWWRCLPLAHIPRQRAELHEPVNYGLIAALESRPARARPATTTSLSLWGSRSRLERVTCRDRQPGMIAAVSLRLLYLIFSQLLSWLTL